MSSLTSGVISKLLRGYSQGDLSALDRLAPLVYEELRRLASRRLAPSDRRHIQTTELVHEAYLRLSADHPAVVESRAHFYALCGRLMRQILVDMARRRHALKRGGEVELQHTPPDVGWPAFQFDTLHDLLNRLEELNSRQVRVVEMRFFAGMDFGEIALALEINEKTARRDWTAARAWLFGELTKTSS